MDFNFIAVRWAVSWVKNIWLQIIQGNINTLDDYQQDGGARIWKAHFPSCNCQKRWANWLSFPKQEYSIFHFVQIPHMVEQQPPLRW
jgi:hypothetical protein